MDSVPPFFQIFWHSYVIVLFLLDAVAGLYLRKYLRRSQQIC